MTIHLEAVDKIEILTLQDNYIDVAAMDSTEMVQRALPLKDGEIKNSILAEHGFSALVSVTADGVSRHILFDFGFSEHGAAINADALNADLSKVETLVLSHGHMDHFGGMLSLLEKVGKKNLIWFSTQRHLENHAISKYPMISRSPRLPWIKKS